MALAQHNLSTSFNPLLSNPPAAPRNSIPAPAPASTPAPAAAPAAAPPAKKQGWQASAARPQNQPKKNTSQMATAAKAAKALAGNGRLQGSASASSLTLSNFPMPGQAMAAVMRPGLNRSTSFNRDDKSDSDASSIRGLGIHPSRSLAQLSNVSAPSTKSPRRPSVGSSGSGGNKGGNSLGDGIGFTFKGTTNFVHPNRQTPRTYTPLSRSQNVSQMSLGYEDEDDDVVVERMNSVTSDGGWKTGWSVGGGSLSGPSLGPNGEPLEEEARPDDVAPEDVHETILEECDDQLDEGERSPGRAASPTRLPTPPNDSSSSTSSSRTGRSLKSRKSSLSIRLRSRDDADTANSSAPTSPIRSSLDKAVGIFARKDDLSEDPASRAASIAAARMAFEEKEAAKDRKHAEKEAKREERRRKSDAHERPLWKRRPSNAVDSAFDSAEEKQGSFTIGRSGSIAARSGRTGSIARAGSIARSNSIAALVAARPLSPEEESCDPLARVPEQESTPESAEFPVYEETVQADHSMFSAAYQEEPQEYHQQYQEYEESALFPPLRSTPIEEVSGGLFPPPNPNQGPAIYNVNGKMFDEYGMPVHQIILPSQRQNRDDDEHSGYADSRGRRQSVTKQAKGKLNKFSAWSKTRLLRV